MMLHTDIEAELRQIFGIRIVVIHADDQLLLMDKSPALRNAIADLLDTLTQERDKLELGSNDG